MKMLPAMKQHGPFKDSDERREFEVRIFTIVPKYNSSHNLRGNCRDCLFQKKFKIVKMWAPLKGSFLIY